MWHLALLNLITRRARTALAVLGLSVAILGMVGLISLAAGMRSMVEDTFRRVQGLVVLDRGAPVTLFSSLAANMREDLEQFEGVAWINAEIWGRANQIDGEPVRIPPRVVFGTELERIETKHGPYTESIIAGRFLKSGDRGTARAVVSKQIAEEADKKLGDSITVNGRSLQVVGVYETGSYLMDAAIIVDIELARAMFGTGNDRVSNFYVELTDPSRAEEIGNAIEARFDQVEARSSTEWTAEFARLSVHLNLFLTITTALALVVGSVGIVNTMLMSVVERRVEFGILRANGWTRQNLLRLVTLESAYLGLLSGMIGTVTGWAAATLLDRMLPITLSTPPSLLAGAILLAVVLGVASGLYPAFRAARMEPMQAIRFG